LSRNVRKSCPAPAVSAAVVAAFAGTVAGTVAAPEDIAGTGVVVDILDIGTAVEVPVAGGIEAAAHTAEGKAERAVLRREVAQELVAQGPYMFRKYCRTICCIAGQNSSTFHMRGKAVHSFKLQTKHVLIL
jgi:hypothetical protein